VGGITSFRNRVPLHQSQDLLATSQWVLTPIARLALSFFVFLLVLSLFLLDSTSNHHVACGELRENKVDVVYYSTLSRREKKVVTY